MTRWSMSHWLPGAVRACRVRYPALFSLASRRLVRRCADGARREAGMAAVVRERWMVSAMAMTAATASPSRQLARAETMMPATAEATARRIHPGIRGSLASRARNTFPAGRGMLPRCGPRIPGTIPGPGRGTGPGRGRGTMPGAVSAGAAGRNSGAEPGSPPGAAFDPAGLGVGSVLGSTCQRVTDCARNERNYPTKTLWRTCGSRLWAGRGGRPGGPAGGFSRVAQPPLLDRAGAGRRCRLRFGNVAEIHDLTVIELARSVRQRDLSPVEITDHYLQRIEAMNADVGAFFTVTAELARDQAARAEKAVAQAADPGSLPPLTGVPIPIKDLNMVAGVRQTLGSVVFKDNVPPEDDYVTRGIRAAGAVITGKTATPEFGLPCYTETDIGPPARTPWDLTRSAGGSSGGAAAAVAAG